MPRFVRTCALVRKILFITTINGNIEINGLPYEEFAATKKPLQVTKGQGNRGRKRRRGSCMHSYMQIKLIEQLLTIRLAPRCC